MANPSKSDPSLIKDVIHGIILNDSEVRTNLGEKILITTEDKIKLALVENLSAVEQQRSWVAPLGLFTSVQLTLLTTDFKDWLVPKETWQAFFMIGQIIFAFWLVISIIRAIKTRGKDDVLEAIRKSALNQEAHK